MKLVIQKGDKFLSSVYLNDLGYRTVIEGGKLIKKPQFSKLFVFRENSIKVFQNPDDFQRFKNNCIEEIQNDWRYDDAIKTSLIKSVNKLDKYITFKELK